MKQYDVKISHAALSDMEQIYSYIADRLLEPDTAMGQYNRIAEAVPWAAKCFETNDVFTIIGM